MCRPGVILQRPLMQESPRSWRVRREVSTSPVRWHCERLWALSTIYSGHVSVIHILFSRHSIYSLHFSVVVQLFLKYFQPYAARPHASLSQPPAATPQPGRLPQLYSRGSFLGVLAVLAVPSTPASASAMQRIISRRFMRHWRRVLEVSARIRVRVSVPVSWRCWLEAAVLEVRTRQNLNYFPSISHSHLQQCEVDLSKCLAPPIAIARHRRSPVTAACGRWDLKRGLGGARRGGTANTALSLAFDGSHVWEPEGISSMSVLVRSLA